jgi:type III secretion protein V
MQLSIKQKKFLNKIPHSKELIIVALIILVLGMMMIPLPPEVMDTVIAMNIGLSVTLLMVVVYIDSPLKLSSFPSILLVLALLRIGITVSTSRLILLDGNAGEIVATFGQFVAGGNLVVGMIVFTIVTIINFIVITKGSERVAEVVARFSLDAMPGKQMSIDSDLRAGNIDMDEAQRRRKMLMLESKLYGSMDGAMKFVKGDAIASIIDILINLCGGIFIGMGQKGLDFPSAIEAYCILTIGDGLVQQIPALVVSLSSGILITHVNDEDNDDKSSLAGNVIKQISRDYNALFAAATLLFLMSLIPGMPSIVLLIMASVIVGLAFFLKRKEGGHDGQQDVSTDKVIEDDNQLPHGKIPDNFNRWSLTPLMINVATNLKESKILQDIKQILAGVREEVLMDLGVEVPQILLRYSDQLAANNYQILVNEIPACSVELPMDKILVLEENKNILAVLDFDKGVVNNTDIGLWTKGVWFDQNQQHLFDEAGLRYLTQKEFMVYQIKFILTSYIGLFLGMQEVKDMLDKMVDLQDLIRELLRMLQLNKITEILQSLIHEGISIRDFKTILNSMLEWGQNEKDVIIISEHVRQSLGRYIAYKFSQGSYVFPCFLLTQDFEGMIRDSIRFNGNGSYLSLDPDTSNKFIDNINQLFTTHNCPKLKVPVVIVTQIDVRRYVRSIIEKRFPNISVLSIQELENNAELNVLDVIDL